MVSCFCLATFLLNQRVALPVTRCDRPVTLSKMMPTHGTVITHQKGEIRDKACRAYYQQRPLQFALTFSAAVATLFSCFSHLRKPEFLSFLAGAIPPPGGQSSRSNATAAAAAALRLRRCCTSIMSARPFCTRRGEVITGAMLNPQSWLHSPRLALE